MNNVYDTAYQLGRDLKELEAFQQLKAAFKAVSEDEAAKALYDEFKQVSQTYQEAMMAGQELSEEQMQAMQDLSGRIGQNVLIQQLMQHEQMISQVMKDINKIITEPLSALYQPQ